jgi:rod shape-determining protein MreC
MAPPSPRRPGFSRRAQLGLFTGYVIAVAGALVGLLLILTARLDPAGHSAIQTFFSDIFSPISRTARAGLAAVQEGGSETSAYFDAASKNREMQAELKSTRAELNQGRAAIAENRRLKRLAGLIERDFGQLATARLVASTGASSRRFGLLGAGAADGIRRGQVVMTSEGLVGRVAEAGQISARVLLIIDGGNIVPIRRVSDGKPALAIGIGDGRLILRPLAAGSNAFNVKDVFVTSGAGGVYRPGIPVAMAIAKQRDTVIGAPLAAPDSYDLAIILPEFLPEPPPLRGELPRGEN